jgi:hypothetical protein
MSFAIISVADAIEIVENNRGFSRFFMNVSKSFIFEILNYCVQVSGSFYMAHDELNWSSLELFSKRREAKTP